jgi:hypothetical protein
VNREWAGIDRGLFEDTVVEGQGGIEQGTC